MQCTGSNENIQEAVVNLDLTLSVMDELLKQYFAMVNPVPTGSNEVLE